MSRSVIGPVLAAIILGAPSFAGAAETRHSGTVVAVDPTARALTIEEIGAGTPGQVNIEKRRVFLDPDASVRLVERIPAAAKPPMPDQWPGGFKASPVSLPDVRPGDFVTVRTEKRDGGLVAREVSVVRPDGASASAR